MRWQHFLMKHGIGSPGYIARRMAKEYRARKAGNPSLDERSILFRVYATRVAAQSILGGPAEYRMSRENPRLMHAAVEQNSDLFSIIRHAVLIEHPEFDKPYAPSDRFEVLDRVISEVLDREIPGWRKTVQQTPPSRKQPEYRREDEKHAKRGTAATLDTGVAGLQEGLSIEAALSLFLNACNKHDTLFITDRWVEPRLRSLRGLLSEPITSDQVEALCDAVMKRAKLDDVIEWLADSKLSWRVFDQHRKEGAAELERIKAEQQKLEYERKFAEAEMAWKTKANTPWEAAMRDKAFQARHDSSTAEQKYGDSAHPCPQCGSREVTWFYYVSPPHPHYELRELHGFAGWMTACERCNVQIDFFDEMRIYY
jgi:hypothetical protein